MKKLGFILKILRLAVLLAGFYVLHQWDLINSSWILILVVLDFGIVYSCYRYIRKLEQENSVVFIVHRRVTNSPLFKSILVALGIWGIIFSFNLLNENIAAFIGVAFPFYVLISNYFFYNGFDGYVIDKSGLTQLSIIGSDYGWNEITDIVVSDKAINYVINTKEYKTLISNKTANKVRSFLFQIGKDHSVK